MYKKAHRFHQRLIHRKGKPGVKMPTLLPGGFTPKLTVKVPSSKDTVIGPLYREDHTVYDYPPWEDAPLTPHATICQ